MNKSFEVEYIGLDETFGRHNWETSEGDITDSITRVIKNTIESSPSLKKKYPKGIKVGTRIKITLIED